MQTGSFHSRFGNTLSDQSCVAELAERYASRREIVAGGLREAGLDVFDSAHYKFTEYRRFNFCLVIFVYIIAALITAHFIKFN